MQKKAEILDDASLGRVLVRMSHEIVEKNKGTEDVVLVGVRTRGVPMARRIAQNIERTHGTALPIGELDITLYRDDLTEIGETAHINGTAIDFDIVGKNVVLCDDVLFTGRTVRAAIDALLHIGRPKTIQLAVVVDRGHREFPIRADYVGKNIPTSIHELVAVKFLETDGKNCVELYSRED